MRAEAGQILGLTADRAIGQLSGIKYRHNSRGQIVIESKDDARKRGVKSPDRAEAVMVAYAEAQYGEPRIRFVRSERFRSYATLRIMKIEMRLTVQMIPR
jgi:hypothetical protein